MPTTLRLIATALLTGLAACALLILAPAAAANTYTPNKLADHAPNGCTHTDCTLREAITKANNHAGGDTIIVQGGKTYDLSQAGAGENLNATGDLDVLASLRIQSSSKKLATVDAHGIDRVFDFETGGVDAALKRLWIRAGSAGEGGGVEVEAGTIKIANSRVSGNTGTGVVINSEEGASAITILKSAISGNHSATNGGGLLVVSGPHARVIDSTISGNTTDAPGGGGGIAVDVLGSLSVTNSTIANNRALATGGGIFANSSAGSTSLRSVTVARNTANNDGVGNDEGGGLSNYSGSFTARNSIVALNAVGAGSSDPDCIGTFSSIGPNLLTNVTGCSGFATPPNIVTSNPRLGPLANNGGPTKTIALRRHSPAINHADSGSPKRDQRGVKRRKHPDVGAYERR